MLPDVLSQNIAELSLYIYIYTYIYHLNMSKKQNSSND